jgi:hypothetical protein
MPIFGQNPIASEDQTMAAYSLSFWQTALPLLGPWRALTVDQRTAALDLTGVFQTLPPPLAALPAKTRTLFFEKDPKGRHKPLPEFRRLIDFVDRLAKWSKPDRLDTAVYIQQLSTYTQRHALTGIVAGPASDIAAAALARRMGDGWFARQWLEQESHNAFLTAVSNWMPEEVPLTPAHFEALKRWLREALDKARPGFSLDAESFLIPGFRIPPEESLYLALAYGLVQIARHPETLEVLVRILAPSDKAAQDPGTLKTITLAEAAAGAARGGTARGEAAGSGAMHAAMRAAKNPGLAHSFTRPFLIDDVEAYLRSLKAEPAPLLVDGSHVPVAHHRKVAKGFLPLPEPLPHMGFSEEDRARSAWWFICALGLVAMAGRGRKTMKAALDPQGEAWLASTRQRKLQALLDAAPFGARKKWKLGDRYAWLGENETLPLPQAALTPRIFDWLDILASRLREPMEIWDWLRGAAGRANPLLADLDSSAYLPGLWARWDRTPEEVFAEFLCHHLGRLCSLGAVSLSKDAHGNLGVSLTPIGRYQFGQADGWKLADEARPVAVVGGDFSIVLLQPAPDLALDLAPFADRAGNVDEGRPVTHFRLTRRSVQAGVHQGMTAADMLRILKAWSRTALPANVIHEIEAWCVSKPVVKILPTILVEGEDAMVMAEVLARFPKEFVRLTPTVLRYLGKGKRPALLKRLANKGFFTE